MHKDQSVHGPDHSLPAREFDGFTHNFVRKSARQLARQFGLPHHDREDIEQHLLQKLVEHLPAGDSSDPRWKALLAKTVRRYSINLVRDRRAAKRDHRRLTSLSFTITTGDGQVELADLVSAEQIPARSSESVREPMVETDLRLDVNELIASLTDEEEREILERLKTDSLSQVARDLGLPRTTLGSRVAKLRKRFEKTSLKKYLPTRRRFSSDPCIQPIANPVEPGAAHDP